VSVEYAFYDSIFGESLIATSAGKVCYLSFVRHSRACALDDLKIYWPRIACNPEIKQMAQAIFCVG